MITIIISPNQTACGRPALKGWVCFGPRARLDGIRNRQIFVCPNPHLEIIVTLLSATGGASLINLRKYENRASVHFIPNLKVGVFVTLLAPDVIKMGWVSRPTASSILARHNPEDFKGVDSCSLEG